MVQTSINKKQAFGVEGSIYDQSPVRADAYIAGEGGVVIGKVCTQDVDTPDFVTLGGTGRFAGIAINHLEYARGGLNASMALPAGSQVSCCTFGHVVVRSATAFKVGYDAYYNNSTGAISGVAVGGSAPASSTIIPNAKFIKVNGGAGELGVLELNPMTNTSVDLSSYETSAHAASTYLSKADAATNYQAKLTAGSNVAISDENVISATDTTYTAGNGISISDQNVISAE